jgi:pimeloyl-ACP methyl ester carboxylesterase
VTLSHHRGGSGEPLVLIHGIGSFWHVWEPVLPALEVEREVVAIDLPGFGGSPVLAGRADPHPAALAAAVAAFLDELGLADAHVAGNSLGGWVALELSKLGRARSVCALSPAGFWTRRERTFATLSLRNGRASAARLSDAQLERIYGNPRLRALALAQFAARPDRMPAAAGIAAARNLAASPGWDATLATMGATHVTGAVDVRPPVTIAWAEKDRLLLPRQAERARRALPWARHLKLFGCGHVPTWDDPALVARTILTSA